MVVLIDGYNLLRNIFPKERGKLTRQRDEFIKQLSYYHSKKGHDIVVVFDGGLFKHATREISGGVVVIFSGQRSTADDWIVSYCERNKNKEILLVSEDRELLGRCAINGVDGLKTHDFYQALQDVLAEDIKKKLDVHGEVGGVLKYSHEDDDCWSDVDREGLDILMSQIDMSKCKKENEPPGDERRKSKSRQMTKKEKKVYKKIKKL